MLVYPNAKINIGLNVVERREDGYHNIETIFYPIGIHDILSIEPSETCTDYSFSSGGISIGGDVEDNLIVKAFHLLRSKYHFPAVDISLQKQIPFGAGLGGGSADAAFALKTFNELFNLKISDKELEELAGQLGADCPFFIKNTPVYATGIGNVFSPQKISLKGYWMLLVKPDIHVSTADAYRGITPTPSEEKLTSLIKLPVIDWKNRIKNDFEKTVFEKFPKIKEIKEKIYDSGALYASMSGSGSSVYGIFKEMPKVEELFADSFVMYGELD